MRWLTWFFAFTLIVLLSRVGVNWWSHNLNVASEANDLYGTLSLADGQPLYPPPSQVPYGIYLYPPVHAYLGASLVWLSGARDLRSQVLWIRGLSLFALLAAFIVLWKNILQPLQVSWPTFLAILILGGSKFSDYATAARNDALALLLEMVALGLFLAWIKRRNARQYLLFFLVCILSLWTRQSGVVFAAAMVFLVIEKEFRRVFWTSGLFVAFNAIAFYLACRYTHGAIIDHVFLSNIRGWRFLDAQLFDSSLLSFLGSYLAFAGLVAIGMKTTFCEYRNPGVRMLALVFGFSFVFAVSVFMRAGGDVNYFFENILVGFFFACRGWDFLWSHSSSLLRRSLAFGMAVQLLFVSLVYVAKDRSAIRDGSRPFAQIAQRIRKELPRYGYVIGPYSEMMAVYLRGWLYQGPDVTSGSSVARNSHASLRWMLSDLHRAMSKGLVTSIVVTTPGCGATWGKWSGAFGDWFGDKEVWDTDICVYRSKHAPWYPLDAG